MQAPPLHEVLDAVFLVEDSGLLEALLHVVHLHPTVGFNVSVQLLLLDLQHPGFQVRLGDLAASPTGDSSFFERGSLPVCHVVEIVRLRQSFLYQKPVRRHELFVHLLLIVICVVPSGIKISALFSVSIIYVVDF